MNRPPDPQGVTYEGGDGIYHINLHGRRVGRVISDQPTKPGQWRACPAGTGGIPGFIAVTRRDAVAALIAWLQEQG